MIHRRLVGALASVSLIASLLPAAAWAAIAQPPPQAPPRTGILMMAVGDPSGTVVYKRGLSEVLQAAVGVAQAQGTVALADGGAGPIRVGLGRVLPDGGELGLTIALSIMTDGRTQVDVTPSSPVDSPPARSATREYVAALTAALAGTPAKMRLWIFTDETRRPNLRNRREAIRYLETHLGGLPVEPVPGDARAKARMWLEVLRVSDDEGVAVRLSVPGTGYNTEWTKSSPRDTGSAAEVVDVFKGWLALNRERLLTGRAAQPKPAVPCAVSPAAKPSTSAPDPTVRLFLGPAPTTDGFVNFDPAFEDSYADLCDAYKPSEAARSTFTLTANRDDADLVLELVYRNEPLLSPSKHELRATLFVAGPSFKVTLNSRAEARPAALPSGDTWRTQATRLLLATVDWVKANGAVLGKARTSPGANAPDR
jgi:hypothetical protein